MTAPPITAGDLQRCLEDLLGDQYPTHEDYRDARRAATMLTPEDCKSALLLALQGAHIAAHFSG